MMDETQGSVEIDVCLVSGEKSRHSKEKVGSIMQPEVVTCAKPRNGAYSRAWQCAVTAVGEARLRSRQHPYLQLTPSLQVFPLNCKPYA